MAMCDCGRKEKRKNRSTCTLCHYDKYKESIKASQKKNRQNNRETYNSQKRKYRKKQYETGANLRLRFATILGKIKVVGKRKVEVTPDDLCGLWEQQNGRCALTGLEMSRAAYSPFSVSIDRIVSEGDYTAGNVQLVCMAINLAKNKFSQEQMVEFIARFREVLEGAR